jgi:threonyl-tRNA synthetase
MADQIVITLPDESTRTMPAGATAADVAAAIGPRLAKSAVAARVDGRLVDLDIPVEDGARVAIVPADTPDGRHVLRHSTAHVLAQAVYDLWPGAHYAIGPAIEDGFYYDFELPGGAHFSEEDLDRIEKRMREVIAEGQPFQRGILSVEEGLDLFAEQPYKREIIKGVGSFDPAEGAEDTEVSIYRNTERFVDLCLGPHVPSTARLGHFKLTKVAAAYWRGDEHRQQLQRIYGTAWESAAALDAYLTRLEEAEKRDHRRLGVELDLFSFPDLIGSGLPVFHPKGGLIRRIMEEYSRQCHEQSGYQFVNTPHITKGTLFETSGHLQWFGESMFPPMELEGSRYYVKPMNCPMHILIYRSRQRSYRELPMRLFEFGSVYRYEKSGVVHGLTRVRGMTQDDAHIFCTRDQMAGELSSLLQFVLGLLRDFGLEDFYLELSTRPEDKAAGTEEEWEEATETLRIAGLAENLELVLDPGGGAFYGPKISVQARDAIGRAWQMSTIQLDFNLPRRFELEYVGADNSRERPVMIHRALFGSIERFFGVLVEHYAGAFPTWLAPVQVRVLPVRDDHDAYAFTVEARLRAEGFRAETVVADEPINTRIRRARVEKVPYVLVVGQRDADAGTVGLNVRGAGGDERDVPLDVFIDRLRADVDTRAVAP